LQRYLERLTGTAPQIDTIDRKLVGELPLYLRSYYSFARTRLFGNSLLLAIQQPEANLATPTEYLGHREVMRSSLDADAVLVLPRVTSYVSQQLIRSGVPFIVPHVQLFLPPMMIDLRSRLPGHFSADADVLTPAAQVVVLRHLLKMPAAKMPLGKLAGELGYSSMAMTNVGRELESFGLCKLVKQGRSKSLVFEESRNAIWEKADPLLRDPVRVRRWVRWDHRPVECLEAGLTALESLTMASDGDLPTLALKDSLYRHLLGQSAFSVSEGAEQAQARVECWSYDPRLLSDGPGVDKLSLYLSLRHVDDERVVSASETLIEGTDW
jgi:hypothetical protein